MRNDINDDELEYTLDSVESGDSPDRVEVVSPRGGQAVKSIFAPANRKRLALYLVAAVLVLGAIFYTFTSFEPATPTAGQGGGSSSGGRVISQSQSADSWVAQEERRRYNEDEFENVQRNNPTAHPLFEPVNNEGRVEDIDLYAEPEQVVAPRNPFYDEPPATAPRSVGEAVSGSNTRQQQQSYVDPKAIDDLLQSLVEAEGATQPRMQAVRWGYVEPQQPANSTNATGDTGTDSDPTLIAGTGSGVCDNPMIRAGDMNMGTTDMALNSDVGGPVSLSIHNGPLRGSRLLGSFERKDKWLRINLDRAVTPDETLDIEAIALDLDTTLNAVEGDLDRHIMYRYGWWGFGTALRAVGRAAEIAADQDVIVSNGTVIQTTSSNSQRETRVALGELGQEIGDVMRSRIDRPITVSLKVGDEIGIFFMDDVCSDLPATYGMRGQ